MTLSPLSLEVSALDASPPPLSLALAKQHLAVDDTDSDTLIEAYILSAIRWAEGYMRRSIYSRLCIWTLADFPRCGNQSILLPRGRAQSVTSIAYSSGGSVTTLTGPSSGSPAGTGYQENLSGDSGGIIMPARNASWPSVDCDVPAPVAIAFTAGWLAGEVPANIEHALLFAVSDAFEIRGNADMASGPTLATRQALLAPYRIKRWY